MTWPHEERLYNLLPAIYRVRDSAQGEPLRGLLSIIEEELELLEADVEGLYENWFVETADEWAIAYIADLLGARPLHTVESAGAFSQRAYVANTLRYRRRKGTAAVLEQLARDVTGWPARAVEFFQRLGTTQHLNHVRLANLRTPDLRRTDDLELVGTPFDSAHYSAEIRRIDSGRGRYNLPNLGLFLWRLQAYAVARGAARRIGPAAAGRYTFNPLGIDAPLFNRPQTETEITELAEEINVPTPLRRRALYDDLEAYRQALVDGEIPRSRYFALQPVLQIFLDEAFDGNGRPIAVAPEEILICDLSDWRRPPETLSYKALVTQPDGAQEPQLVEMPIRVAVDPRLGRVAFPVGGEPESVHVSYAYGFAGDVGGGPYQRRQTVDELLADWIVDWQVGVAQSPELAAVDGETIFGSLAEAVQAWNAQPPGTTGVIAIMDSYTYTENLTGEAAIQIPAESRLLIVAADWPKTPITNSLGQETRVVGQVTPTALRPHLRGNLSVRGVATAEALDAGGLFLDGLLVEGNLRALIGNLGRLHLAHCTLAPEAGDLTVNGSGAPGLRNDRLQLRLLRTICGGIDLPETAPKLLVEESIVDRPGALAISAPGAEVSVDASTILGGAAMRSLEASNSIFTEPVVVERRQSGCVRFSSVPDGSRTPRRHRCQPDLALKDVADPAVQANLRVRLTPLFTASEYGDPAYCQLSLACAEEIRTGAEDGSEMGVFHHLKEPQRAANLRSALDEYLPFGLAAGAIYVT
jgi:hypothetical protein